ncbi:MAG: protein translocase subunit SecF [Antricoccus sp.]
MTEPTVTETPAIVETSKPAKKESFAHRLYTGETEFQFVARRKTFFIIGIALVVASLALLVFRGLNFGIDFVGGNTFQVPGKASELTSAQAVVEDGLSKATPSERGSTAGTAKAEIASAQVVGSGNGTSLLIKTSAIDPTSATNISNALAAQFRTEIVAALQKAGTPVTEQNINAQVSNQAIDATWGGDVSRKALIALIVFLVVVSIFLRIRYQLGLVAGALIALLHDLIIATGVYSLVGFEVTPATVIGLLTILGFSLYDTVVVFDKVDENTKGLLGGSRMTYSEAANLAVNQTLMRSINTTLISLLPVAALLFVGAGILGAGTLKDLALVLLIGMAAGAYSSIFLAAPIATVFAERRTDYIDLARRVKARRERKTSTTEAGSETASQQRARAQRDRELVASGVGAKPRPGARPVPAKPVAQSMKSPLPATVLSKAANPKAGASQSITAQSAAPKTAAAKTPKAVAPETAAPKTPKAVIPKTAAPKTTAPKTPKAVTPKTAAPTAVTSKNITSKTAADKTKTAAAQDRQPASDRKSERRRAVVSEKQSTDRSENRFTDQPTDRANKPKATDE